jgi:hypothetical protein
VIEVKNPEYKMPVYVIAELIITDRVAYSRYQKRFMSVLSRFKGSLLAPTKHR